MSGHEPHVVSAATKLLDAPAQHRSRRHQHSARNRNPFVQPECFQRPQLVGHTDGSCDSFLGQVGSPGAPRCGLLDGKRRGDQSLGGIPAKEVVERWGLSRARRTASTTAGRASFARWSASRSCSRRLRPCRSSSIGRRVVAPSAGPSCSYGSQRLAMPSAKTRGAHRAALWTKAGAGRPAAVPSRRAPSRAWQEGSCAATVS
jgi:hypothetical protein